MSFKKSNKHYAENVKVMRTIELLDKFSLAAVACFYMEYRITYYHGDKIDKELKFKTAVRLLYETMCESERFSDMPCFEHFCFKVDAAAARKLWETIYCVIDGLRLDSGYSGKMKSRRFAELIEIIQTVLEVYYDLPLARILKEVARAK